MKLKITKEAKKLGFDLVGFAPARINSPYLPALKKWLTQGYNGKMDYMQTKLKSRDLSSFLPNAKSVIVLGTNYYHTQKPLPKGHGRIARYAYGRDYHKIIQKKLKQLIAFLKIQYPEAEFKSFVDAGPTMERPLAVEAGLGHIGKNTCLITKEFGSWIFLSEIITTLNLSTHPQKQFSICGTCTRCIDSCPTKAIIAPGVIDARKCISYLSIENKNKIPKNFHAAIKKHKRLFGCDICQEVCPHNCRAQETIHQEFLEPIIAGDSLNLKEISNIKTDVEFLKRFAGSPLMRAKRKGLQRTANIVTVTNS